MRMTLWRTARFLLIHLPSSKQCICPFCRWHACSRCSIQQNLQPSKKATRAYCSYTINSTCMLLELMFFFIRNGSFCLNLRCFDAEFKFFYLCIVSFLCTLCTIFCTSRWWHKSFCLSFCNRDRRHGWTLVLQRKLYCCSILIIFFLSFSLSSAMHSASPWHARGDIYMDSCRPKRLN